jgi:hypothetical protein
MKSTPVRSMCRPEGTALTRRGQCATALVSVALAALAVGLGLAKRSWPIGAGLGAGSLLVAGCGCWATRRVTHAQHGSATGRAAQAASQPLRQPPMQSAASLAGTAGARDLDGAPPRLEGAPTVEAWRGTLTAGDWNGPMVAEEGVDLIISWVVGGRDVTVTPAGRSGKTLVLGVPHTQSGSPATAIDAAAESYERALAAVLRQCDGKRLTVAIPQLAPTAHYAEAPAYVHMAVEKICGFLEGSSTRPVDVRLMVDARHLSNVRSAMQQWARANSRQVRNCGEPTAAGSASSAATRSGGAGQPAGSAASSRAALSARPTSGVSSSAGAGLTSSSPSSVRPGTTTGSAAAGSSGLLRSTGGGART